MTEWRQLREFPEHEISDSGELRRIISGRNIKAGDHIKGYVDAHGYVTFSLRLFDTKKRVIRKSHRLVAEAFLGEAPSPVHEVAHADGDKTNNNVFNLRWATRKENHADKRLHGTSRAGEKNNFTKLTENEVIFIRNSFANKSMSIGELATMMNVTFSNVWYIVHRKSWQHI